MTSTSGSPAEGDPKLGTDKLRLKLTAGHSKKPSLDSARSVASRRSTPSSTPRQHNSRRHNTSLDSARSLTSRRSTPSSSPQHPATRPAAPSSPAWDAATPRPLATTHLAAGTDIPVSVVVNIRPMMNRELSEGCQSCLSISSMPDALPEVSVAGYAMRSFPFDRVYGEGGLHSSKLFDDCVAPLVDGLFEGYNATVLAYGQTGAGKTFTIGTHPKGAEGDRQWPAVIPQFTDMMFAKAAALAQDGRASATATVSFLELYQNSIHDMLADNHKTSHVEIRERGGTQVEVEGQREVAVASAAEVDTCLQRGIAARATHATNMNDHSSRSHAIFTVSLQVKRWRPLPTDGGEGEEGVEETLSAKIHLVDLAGSERLKKSGAEGQQQKEAACINLGLLSLRNCIEALCTPNRGHVPYRSHKLTRLLQDSLGGNSRTVMIACVSPSDSNMEETLNTLKYTSSARTIKNKLVANRDEQSAAALAMMEELRRLRQELADARRSSAASEALEMVVAGPDTASQELEAIKHERDSWQMRACVAESMCVQALYSYALSMTANHEMVRRISACFSQCAETATKQAARAAAPQLADASTSCGEETTEADTQLALPRPAGQNLQRLLALAAFLASISAASIATAAAAGSSRGSSGCCGSLPAEARLPPPRLSPSAGCLACAEPAQTSLSA
eukprot:CAMPEP_0117678092 /NCGR_PEP_ID=MMETSP0804-20121206/17093_1 /TAXON_ID=1074897 /ORGANISM="Tetraselmis astigmatica, Strain CCMP880" /LENGTH=677 /DNA_ID=CAMNT_0005487417 /DNA_START=496 /DNA_END=2530 /DNA_ORIENTATION=-